jgi:serine/threonine-protein kinase
MKLSGPLVTLALGALVGGAVLATSSAAARPGTVVAAASTASTAPTAPTPAAEPPAPPPATAVPQPPAADAGATPDAGSPLSDGELAAYAGRLPGGRYSLVMAVRDDRVVAYVCDGDTVESWLRGTVSGPSLSLRGKNGETLTATLVTGRASGTLEALGERWSFTVSAVDPASVRTVTAKVAP